MNKRLGAGSYMVWASTAFVAWALLSLTVCEWLVEANAVDLKQLNFIVSGFGVVLGVVFYGLSARRLKDLNMPPWLVKLLAFPVLALILMPYLLLVSGPQAENQYGSAPPSSGLLKIFGAVVLLFLAMNFSFAAVLSYCKARSTLSGQPLGAVSALRVVLC